MKQSTFSKKLQETARYRPIQTFKTSWHMHTHIYPRKHALVLAVLGHPLIKNNCLLSDPMLASRPQWPGSWVTFCGLACPVASVPGWRSRLSGFAQNTTSERRGLKQERESETGKHTSLRWQHKSHMKNHICDCGLVWELPKIAHSIISDELYTNVIYRCSIVTSPKSYYVFYYYSSYCPLLLFFLLSMR